MSHKLVMVGASGHPHLVLRALPALPQVQFAAYASSYQDEDVSLYGDLENEMPAPRGYSDWREMLDRERPDIVVACGRNDLNAVIATEAAGRGCHVYSEKPAAQNLVDLRRLHQTVRDRDVRYGIMLNMRYEPAFYTAHIVVRDGLIGEPYLITGQKSYRWGNSRPEWYADPNKYGTTMTWIGIHAFDLARWVGGVAFIKVSGYHANLVHTDRPACQDVATVIARLENGGSAVFNLDYLRPAAAPTHGDDRLRIAGSKGVLEVRDAGRRLHVITGQEDTPTWPLQQPERGPFADFVAGIEGRGTTLISADEAFEITAFAIQAAAAANDGRRLCLIPALPQEGAAPD